MANRTKFTISKRRKALAILAKTGSTRKAAKAVGISFRTIYDKRDTDEAFAEGFKTAMREYQTVLEEEADRRAVKGIDKPVGFFQGHVGEWIKEYSDTLLMFRLKSIDPDKYRDNSKVEHSGELDIKGVSFNTIDPNGLRSGKTR